MTMPLNRAAYRDLIRENLAWLESTPRTLERDHVIAIVKASEAHEYDCSRTLEKLTSTRQKLAESADEWKRKEAVMIGVAQEIERKLASAEARVKELEAELSQSFELAELQLYAEKLAGNIVKEEFWKGELSALHRIRKAIQGKADK